jgi:hypothetical protein
MPAVRRVVPTLLPLAWRRIAVALPTGLLPLLALTLALTLAGCTTAQDRDSPSHILGVLRFRDAKSAALFNNTHRAGNLYQDFRTVMSVDAVPMELQYRRLYLDMLKQRYLLSDAQLATMQADNDQDFNNNFDLIVLIYGGSNEVVSIEKPNSVWRVLLQDDDGEILTPTSVEKIRQDSPVYSYINLYFYGLDRWTQLYRMRFPKLAKDLVGKAIGPKPVQLIVTGVAGTVVLSWRNTAIFYHPGARSAATSAEPAPASQSTANVQSR